MRPDVHAAALRSAAKLVLGMASFAAITTGCSSESTDDTGATSDAVMTKDDTKKNDTMVDLDLGNGDGKPTTAECKTTLESAFPSPSFQDYGVTSAQPANVLSCCDEELSKHGASTAYRWACCFAYDENATIDPGKDGNVDRWDLPLLSGSAHGWACTPWGPPVPPAMNRLARSRKQSSRRREMNTFIAAQLVA